MSSSSSGAAASSEQSAAEKKSKAEKKKNKKIMMINTGTKQLLETTTNTTIGTAAAAASQDPESVRRVLIGVDRSDHSERAVMFYADHLRRPGDLVIFVNVTEPPEVAIGFGTMGALATEVYARSIDQTLCEAKQLAGDVRALCDQLGIGRIKFLERIAHGPGQAIVKIARDERVDFIVMGTRAMGALKRTFVGSVSDYVLHHARRPVVIVPPPPRVEPPHSAPSTSSRTSSPAGGQSNRATADASSQHHHDRRT